VSKPLIALAGNPNTGKTTLFNALTKSRAKVGNYPGITVDRREAKLALSDNTDAILLDIPGTYSLVARTGEEQIALETMVGLRGQAEPDAVVICVDATQLVRSCFLVMQAQEFGLPVVIAMTMVEESGDSPPDTQALSKLLSCPVVPVVARDGEGLDELKAAISKVMDEPSQEKWRWKPSKDLDADLASLGPAIPHDWPKSRAMSLWALMSVDADDELVAVSEELRQAVSGTKMPPSQIDDEVIEARYRWLDAHVSRVATAAPDRSFTDRVDRILLNRFAGFAVFLLVMFLMFQSLFAWADPAIGLIEEIFSWTGDKVAGLLPQGIFSDFIVLGVIAGVGAVVVFLPQILLLFFFVGLMEDSGYMARVAYLMDRIMQSMKLHGRAFVPMLSGFACAVPAILATRTMERQRDRLLTMMVVPLMTCSARLPVYTLLIAAFFPAATVFGVFPVQGLLMVGMYLFSTVTALIAAWVLSRTIKPLKATRLPFVIELPPYRLPRLRDVLTMMWERTSYFLKEAGTVILVCTIILWALLSFPKHLDDPTKPYEQLILEADAETAEVLKQEQSGELLRNSYGGRLGQTIEPLIEPLGFDWKIGVGLIGAFAAREVFISTMGVVYSVGEEVDESSDTLRTKLESDTRPDGSKVFTPLVALSLMIFFALACQCMSTLAVVKRETKGFTWPLFLFGYMTALAWGASFLVFQIGRLLGFS
jgi:ferrous iron transport protein B